MDHGVAPDALVDLLALQDLALGLGEQLDQLELAPGELDGDPAHERLELVGTDLDLADRHRRLVDAHVGALAAPDDGLDASDQLFRVAGLGHPVVGAQPQPAHALGHGGLAGADDHAQPGQPRAELVEVRPALRTEHGEVDHDRVQPQRDHRVQRNGRGEHAVLPTHPLQALSQHLEKTRVGIDNRQADRRLTRGAHAPLVAHLGLTVPVISLRTVSAKTFGDDVQTPKITLWLQAGNRIDGGRGANAPPRIPPVS